MPSALIGWNAELLSPTILYRPFIAIEGAINYGYHPALNLAFVRERIEPWIG
jgi:hypothetical protein